MPVGKRILNLLTGVRLYGMLAFACILLGVFWGVYRQVEKRAEIATAFSNLEKLLAIYSIMSFRDENQSAPVYVEDLSFGGVQAVLDCPEIEWGEAELNARGQLFDCFLAPKTYWVSEASEEFIAPQVFPTESATPNISWESVFGYELYYAVDVISDSVFEIDELCISELEEFSDHEDICFVGGYSVVVSGLPGGQSFRFTAEQGEILYNDDLSINRARDWRISLGSLEAITLGQLNRFIQVAIREMGIASTEVDEVAPALEAAWRRRDIDFVDGLMKSIAATDDLADLSKYLRTP